MSPANARSRFGRPNSVVALQRLELAGLKNHPQRTAVIEAFFSSTRHVTAEDLALELRARSRPKERTRRTASHGKWGAYGRGGMPLRDRPAHRLEALGQQVGEAIRVGELERARAILDDALRNRPVVPEGETPS